MVAINATQLLHLLHPVLLTLLSDPWEPEEHLETASQPQELRRSCKTAKEALGRNERLQVVTLSLLSELQESLRVNRISGWEKLCCS